MSASHASAPSAMASLPSTTLADVQPGCRARVVGLAGLSTKQHAHLQAYGLEPGQWVHVLQQSPVTILQVEHTLLAVESEIARAVIVAKGPSAPPNGVHGREA